MRSSSVALRLALSFCLLAVLMGGCGRPGERERSGTPHYYNGQVGQKATASVGPLRLSIWRVDYEGGYARRSHGGLYESQPVTRTYLKLKNNGASTVTLFRTAWGHGAPPQPPPYYLVDDRGQRYPATGQGWSSQAGDPRAIEGKALPGQTVEFTLEFGGVPRSARSLALVMDSVRAADGRRYSFRLPLELPRSEGTRTPRAGSNPDPPK